MKIAIIGNTGYIAGFLKDSLIKKNGIEIILIGRNMAADEFLDLNCVENFSFDALEDVDYILFAAAVSSPDICAQEFEKCWKTNVDGTSRFINEAMKRRCRILFFSSDAVYGDSKGMVYDERSKPKAITPYGKMKKEVEDRFTGSSYFKSIRLPYVVSANDKFMKYCLGCMKNHKKAEIFHPFYRNCITAGEITEIICWLLEHWETFSPPVLNAAGRELISRVRIADEINRIYKNQLQYDIIQSNHLFFANRHQITQMESIYLKMYQILEEKSFTERIKKELENVRL